MDTPMSLVRACLASLPRLTAEENFLVMQRVAMGTGSFSADVQTSVQRRWSDQADPTVKAPKVKAPKVKAPVRTESVARAVRGFDAMARKHDRQQKQANG